MSSEESSTLALAPMVRFFTYAVIKSMKSQNLEHRKYTVHADMVPKFTDRIIQASLGERTSIPEHLQKPLEPVGGELVQNFSGESNLVQNNFSNAAPDIKMPKELPAREQMTQNNFPVPAPNFQPQNQMLQNDFGNNQIVPPQEISDENFGSEELTSFYGKITPLLNDPSVSVIECQGQGKPIMISRMGHKQTAKIVLSEKDINQVLEKASEAAHIPIMEGVFRAAIDSFSINAVISEMIGSRFVIRKQQTGPPMGMMRPPMGPPGFR